MGGNKKKSKGLGEMGLLFLLFIAIPFDLLGFIPLIGIVIGIMGILVIRLILFIMGIGGMAVLASTMIGFMVEIIPGLSEAAPTSTLFVIAVYFISKAEKKAASALGGEDEEKDPVLRERDRMQKNRASVAQRRQGAIQRARERREGAVSADDDTEQGAANTGPLRQRSTVQSGPIVGARQARRETPLLGGPARFSENRERLERAERSKKKQEMTRNESERLRKAA
ncbi:MAG: hypothetical protein Q8Q32_02535 [bacterium]|nr:hypothetical protein [bacterium]